MLMCRMHVKIISRKSLKHFEKINNIKNVSGLYCFNKQAAANRHFPAIKWLIPI